MSNHNKNTNPFLFKSRFCDEISKISWTRVIEGPNKMKPIKTLLFLLLFAIFVFCFLHGVLFNRPFKRFIYYYLWPPLSKISLPFQVQLSKIHMVHKIKNTQTFISTSTTIGLSNPMSTTLTQKHNFAEKMTTIYAIVLLSIRFLYRSVIGDHPRVKNHVF